MANNNVVRLNTSPELGAQLRRVQRLQRANGFKVSLENLASIAIQEGMAAMVARLGLDKRKAAK